MQLARLSCALVLVVGLAHAQTEIIVDNTDAGFSVSGSWFTATGTPGYYGINYRERPVCNPCTATATWSFTAPSTASYSVYAWWPANSTRPPDAQYMVTHASGSTPVSVNQQQNGGQWNLLGTFNFNQGAAYSISVKEVPSGKVVADAVRIVAAAPLTLYYVHVDHLNTPRAIYDANQQLRWKWDQEEPFGENAPDENPSGLGAFQCNVRFPGQYFDLETGLHYNNLRDYGAAIGRYVEADPFGVLPYRQPQLGVNHMYAYGASSPLSNMDPLGLCPCSGCTWNQTANLAFGFMPGGGAQFSIDAILTCKADRRTQCKANIICIGGGPMVSGGLGADLFGEVRGACDSGDLSTWSSGFTGSFGPISGTGFFGGGGSVSLLKGFGGGIAYVSCRAYYVSCNCDCKKARP